MISRQPIGIAILQLLAASQLRERSSPSGTDMRGAMAPEISDLGSGGWKWGSLINNFGAKCRKGHFCGAEENFFPNFGQFRPSNFFNHIRHWSPSPFGDLWGPFSEAIWKHFLTNNFRKFCKIKYFFPPINFFQKICEIFLKIFFWKIFFKIF